jgi:hypothetical protein
LTNFDHAKAFLNRTFRRRDHIKAWIRQGNSFATQPCRVVEVSRTSVRLEAVNAHNIPDSFLLLFSRSGSGHQASVVWRRGSEVGAAFSSPLSALPGWEA